MKLLTFLGVSLLRRLFHLFLNDVTTDSRFARGLEVNISGRTKVGVVSCGDSVPRYISVSCYCFQLKIVNGFNSKVSERFHPPVTDTFTPESRNTIADYIMWLSYRGRIYAVTFAKRVSTSVAHFLTRRAAGIITQVLLARVIAWQIVLSHW